MADPFDVILPETPLPPINVDVVEIKTYRIAKARDGSDVEIVDQKFNVQLANLQAQKVSLETELAKINKQITLAQQVLGK